MLDLVYKDLVQHRKLILFYALIGGLIGVVMMLSGSDAGAIFSAYVMVSTYGFAIRSTYDEDKSGAYLFLKSLPLSDSSIVTAKFLSVLTAAVISVVFFNAAAVFGSAISTPGALNVAAILGKNIPVFAIVFSVAMVFAGIYLVMFFWAGFAKASTYSRALLLVIFVVVMLGSGFMERSPVVQNSMKMIEMGPWIPAISIVISLAVYGLCCFMSILRVKAKDWS